MTTAVNYMSIKYFDTLEYVRKSKELKDPEALASYQVKQIESAIETAVQHVKHDVQSKDLATKTDLFEVKNELELKIADLRYDMLKFIVWTGLGGVVTLGGFLGGMMAHGFHWI